jgi:hypothetical protein
VAGIDRNSTKTGEDRRIDLSGAANPRSPTHLARPNETRRKNRSRSFVFSGRRSADPACSISLCPLATDVEKAADSASKSLQRSPYLGELESDDRQAPLWVAKQHGHSVATMLRVYTAWMDSAPESDIAGIKDAMGMTPSPTVPAMNTTANQGRWSKERRLRLRLSLQHHAYLKKSKSRGYRSAFGTGFSTPKGVLRFNSLTYQRKEVAKRVGFEGRNP